MRVGIVALDLLPGEMGGIETYFRDLVAGIKAQENSKEEYVIFLSRKNKNEIIPEGNVSVVVVGRSIVKRAMKRLGFSHGLFAPKDYLAAQELDIVHYPFQVRAPFVAGPKSVVSVMDIQQEYFPEYFSDEDLESRRKAFRPSFECADKVIAISSFTKETLIDKYRIDSDKISVVPLCYDEDLYSRKAGTELATSLSLPKNYLYYPAASWPHKNHIRLLHAFSRVLKKHPDLELVFSGVKKQADGPINIEISKLGLNKKVKILGYLDREELPAVYSHAVALIYPSVFEGFGIPVLEAMAVGCPVVASALAAIPEAAGEAALYFDPLNVSSIALAINSIVDDSRLRNELVKKGYNRVTKFTRDRMAELTIGIYRDLYASK